MAETLLAKRRVLAAGATHSEMKAADSRSCGRLLRAALKFEEGWGQATSLRSIFLEASGARDVNELLHGFYTPEFPRPRIAAFAKLVDDAAENGDAIAREIFNDAARELAASLPRSAANCSIKEKPSE